MAKDVLMTQSVHPTAVHLDNLKKTT